MWATRPNQTPNFRGKPPRPFQINHLSRRSTQHHTHRLLRKPTPSSTSVSLLTWAPIPAQETSPVPPTFRPHKRRPFHTTQDSMRLQVSRMGYQVSKACTKCLRDDQWGKRSVKVHTGSGLYTSGSRPQRDSANVWGFSGIPMSYGHGTAMPPLRTATGPCKPSCSDHSYCR